MSSMINPHPTELSRKMIYWRGFQRLSINNAVQIGMKKRWVHTVRKRSIARWLTEREWCSLRFYYAARLSISPGSTFAPFDALRRGSGFRLVFRSNWPEVVGRELSQDAKTALLKIFEDPRFVGVAIWFSTGSSGTKQPYGNAFSKLLPPALLPMSEKT